MSVLVTASGLERAAACPASVSLPQVRGGGSPHAARGTAIHRYLARVLEVGRPAALDEIEGDDLRFACECIDIETLPAADGGQWLAEVAFAYNPATDTARELGRHVDGRDYSAVREGEVPGTADVIGLIDDEAVVIDYKNGRRAVTKAERNWQLALLALAACRAYGKESALVAIVYVREERHYYDSARFDWLELEEWAGRIREAQSRWLRTWASVQAGTVPSVTEGEHCHYCPAFAGCPAKVAMMRTLGSEPGALLATAPAPMTMDVAATAYRRWKMIKEALSRVGDQIVAFAEEHGGIDLGDGLVYGKVQTEREQVDGEVARKVLVEKYGQAIADRACSWDVTKASIKKAAQTVAMTGDGKVAPVEREMLTAVREAGGVQVKHSSTLKEHARKAG